MVISLREIDKRNWAACAKLQVAPHQQHFVAPNVYSIAWSKFESSLVPLAVYDGGTLVGFVMYGVDADDGFHWIYRLMVDQRYQQRGYGVAAMRAVLARLRQTPGCDAVKISYVPDNHVAAALYTTLGFRENGEIIDGEVVALLRLDKDAPHALS